MLQRPGTLALLLGGSALVTTTYILSLYYASLAFGGGLSLATVGTVYLVGTAVGRRPTGTALLEYVAQYRQRAGLGPDHHTRS